MHQSQSNSMTTYDIGTTSNMVFDEVFSDWSSTIDINASSSKKKKCVSHSDSPPTSHEQHRRQQADMMPDLAPLSPCFSDESSSSTPAAAMPITGQYSNIEYRYHVDPRVLGTGHHGSVRECIHRATGRRYAVKSVRKNAPGMKSVGLTREITLLREMRKHRGFVQLVDVHEDEDYVHIVTNLCKGGELFDKIMMKASSSASSNNGSPPCFTEAEAARIMHQLLDAVSHMHDNDIAHRDIKPENILFETAEEDSPIRIIDFGLSRRHYDCEPPMNNVVGTPYYIAPEVLRRKYTKSCDLWSVGVIAYILLCGYPPFNGDDNNAVYDAVRRGRYSFPAADWSGTSREARHFIRCLLQKDPQKRMTALQALNHPWIAKHRCNINNKSTTTIMSMGGGCEGKRQDYSSVEVVYDVVSERDSVIMIATKKARQTLPF